MARPFSNDMFQDGYEPNYEPDYSGIMNPELTNAVAMRKDANESAKGATDQYEADVADYKNGQATEAEEGIASLPQSNNPFTNNSFEGQGNTKFPMGSDGEPILFGAEDVDYTGIPGSPINTTYTEPNIPFVPVSTNPYINVLANIPGEPEPVYDPYVPPAPVYDPYVPPVVTSLPEAEDSVTYIPPVANDTGETTPYVPPNDLPDYPFVDPETGGDYVLVVGDPTNPGPGVVVTDPVTGDLPDGYVPYTGVGPAGTTVDTDEQVDFDVPFDVSPPSGLGFNEIDLSEFGIAPEMVNLPSATYAGLDNSGTGLANGGRVPMGNNNRLNSGLSRLPINQQNDTLTQVFQSGFRPRR